MLMPNRFQSFWHINNPVPSLFLSKTDQNIPEGISSDIFNNDFLSRDKGKKERVLQRSQSASKLSKFFLRENLGCHMEDT